MTNGLTIGDVTAVQGQPVYSQDGEKIGTVEEIFYDEATSRPEWVGIGTGLFGTKRVLVPVEGADLGDDGLFVQYGKDQVENAPDVDSDEIGEETERALYFHYGLSYSERRSETVLPEGTPLEGAPTTGEASVTRHEEELRVGKREVETGRARLRKWVETEPVTADVQLERERVRVEREPVDRPAAGAELGEQEVEVPVHREEPVVEKQTVAKERVGLDKDVESERETVADEVRKERVDVEGDAESR